MKTRLTMLCAAIALAVVASSPAPLHGQQMPAGQQMDQMNMMKMMEQMKAADAKLDELVARMNSSTGTAKTDAMAELLTTLVQQHHMMRESMGTGMMMRMNMAPKPEERTR